MKNKLLKLLSVIFFFCISLQNVSADITMPNATGEYTCNMDGTVQVTVTVTYTSASNEWLDCVTITFPTGWNFVSSVSANDIGSAGNVIAYGDAMACPVGDSDFSPLGGSPNIFAFVMTPPAGFNTGVCGDAGDGDPISFTWDYAGDGYGNAAGPASPGVNGGEATTQSDIVDAGGFVPPPVCNAGDIAPGFDSLTVCDGNIFILDVINDTIPGDVQLVFFNTYQGNGVTLTGGGGNSGFPATANGVLLNPANTAGLNLVGGFLPFASTADLSGALPQPGFEILTGTWYFFIEVFDEFGTICDTAGPIAVNFTPDACPDPAPACDAMPDASPVAVCSGEAINVDLGANCSQDPNVFPGAQNEYLLLYEIDANGNAVTAGTNGTVYSTVQEINDTINADITMPTAGEVVINGFGTCADGTIPSFTAFTNQSGAPVTLDMYLAPFESSSGGTIITINGTCPVTTVTVTINPAAPDVFTTDGDCDNDGVAVIGYDFDGDGTIDEAAGDVILSTLTASSEDLSPFPCDGPGSSEAATLTVADLEALLGVAAGSGCYTDDISVTATCASPACPACDATPSVLAVANEACSDGSTGPATLSEDTAGAGGTNEYIVTDADGSVTGTADVIISVGSFQEAEDAVAALGTGETVCVTAMTYDQPGLDGIVADLNTCTGGLAGSLLGLPTTGNTFEIVFEAIVAFSDPDNPGLTIAGVEALIGGGGGGPGLGGEADLSALLPGLACPVAPFCYRLSNTVCAVGGDACPIDPCEGATATACDDGDPCTTGDMETIGTDGTTVCVPCAGTVDASSCDAACSTTQACDDGDPCTTGDMETVAADGSVCVPCAGTVDASSCDAACSTTQACDDGDPCTTGDMETVAADGSVCVPCAGTVDASSCDAACSTTQACDDSDPCTTGDMETIAADGSVCVPCAGTVDASSCDAACSTTQACDDGDANTINDMETVAADGSICVPCAGTATSCDTDPTTTQACDDGDPCTTGDMETVLDSDGSVCVPCAGTVDASSCDAACSTTQACDDGDPCTTGETETVAADGSVCVPCGGGTAVTDCNCTSTVQACDDGDPCTLNDMETVADNGDVCVPCTGEANPACDFDCPDEMANFGDACDDGDATTINDIVQSDCSCAGVTVPGCTDANACNFDPNATVDDSSCVFATGCDVCDGSGGVTDNPEVGDACDDGDASTENDIVQADCSCVGTAIVGGCTDAAACNFDATATEDNGSCILPGDACDDGDAGTENDTVQADCSCAGTVVAVSGCTDAAACNFDAAATADDGSCILPGDTCDDGDAGTENDTVQADCSCAGTSIVGGCTDATACNFDAAATVDNGSCVLPGDSCNDGNPLTVNDTVQADCSCAGTESGEPIPTVGEWGLIILALILLNLGVLYIRQTEIKIVSE